MLRKLSICCFVIISITVIHLTYVSTKGISPAYRPFPNLNAISSNIKTEKGFEVIKDFIKRHGGKVEWILYKQSDLIIGFAAGEIAIEDSIFITVNIGAEASLFKIIKDNNSGYKMVDFNMFKAYAGLKLGFYNGFDLYVAFIEGHVSVFDIRIGFGVSSGFGINKDSFEIKYQGWGVVVGRRIGVSAYDSEFAIDFKRIFSETQWKDVRRITMERETLHGAFTLVTNPHGFLISLGLDLVGIWSSGRKIEISIENFCLDKFELIDEYFESGKMENDPRKYLPRGEKTIFSVSKKTGFYGVEGVLIYRLKRFNMDFVFYFNNQYLGGNKIDLIVYYPGNTAESLFTNLKTNRKPSDKLHVVDYVDYRVKFTITEGNHAKAAFQIISRKLLLV